MPVKWEDSIQYLKGVGPKRAALFAKLDVETLGDLLNLLPRGYTDYSNPLPVAAAPYDLPCCVRAEVLSKSREVRIKGGRTMIKVHCTDDSAALDLVFFNNPYGVQKLELGKEYLFYGRVGGGFAGREMIAPTFLPADGEAPLTPVYPLTAGLSNYVVANCVQSALAAVEGIPEPLPPAMLEKYRMPGKADALRMIHRPAGIDEVAAARRRLVFEELFVLQLGMLLMRGRGAGQAGAPMKPAKLDAFYTALPFKLTGAQQRAIDEMCGSMTGKAPMNRLLQGDVGSGKTMVAAAGVVLAAQNGYQSVLMAPTEILARQHADTLEKTLAPLGLRVALLTGSVKGKARTAALKAIAAGEADLVVGTHAVLSEPVTFKNLGFAVTDEQHRFGVRQRGLLAAKAKPAGGRKKAAMPHLLVMSATPIPRTLALLMFGDLDVSVLDELPPGRQPVKTRLVPVEKRSDMFGFLAGQIAQGRQVYIVCPLIEEGEGEGPAAELQAASAYAEQVARPHLPKARVGLLHGRMKPAEKTAVMDDFKAGRLDALVSTTVIEVGVDVPNASVMVIEDAERYGLSALHQLRGRVGRGAAESWCFLVSGHLGEAAEKRLRFLCATQDGLEVARYDLETRGPGDFFGSRQHGLPTLRVASLADDTRVLKAAQDEAGALLRADPRLAAPEHTGLANAVEAMFERSTVMN
ncbi:ATP-dependent DNA helicase RecG [Ruminococcaceae bacterium OttesenSCG-928-A11]|nr:ATP-dependent DNA helicase RecG [Ruminococcaceae bacterium OttesenSCG-928-A11]